MKVHSGPKMARRNAVRRTAHPRNLNEGQTQEAMKILEEFCMKKYRNTMLISTPNLDEPAGGGLTPNRPFSSCQPSRQMTLDRQSTIFTFGGSFHDQGKPNLGPDGQPEETQDNIIETLRFKKNRDSLCSYVIRIGKMLNDRIGLSNILYVLAIIGFSLFGGVLFQFLEQEGQLTRQADLLQLDRELRVNMSQAILEKLHESGCISRLEANGTDAELQYSSPDSSCIKTIQTLLSLYVKEFRKNHGVVEMLPWTFWNAVFFSSTIYTTIGYGNMYCQTVGGRISSIFYALFGIPLLFYFVSSLGKGCFGKIIRCWRKMIGCSKRFMAKRRSKRCTSAMDKGSVDPVSVVVGPVEEQLDEDQKSPNDEELFDVIPVGVGIAIAFLFLVISALGFMVLEGWNFITAIYFTFMSLTTIGLGDEVPVQTINNFVLYIFYIVGLGVIGTFNEIVQQHVKIKYMYAFELIEEFYNGNSKEESEFDALEGQRSQPADVLDVRWRGDHDHHRADSPPTRDASPRLRRRSTLVVTGPGETPVAPPPVLAVFVNKAIASRRKSLVRSDSVLSRGGSFNSKMRPFSISPSQSELLTPTDFHHRSPWPFVQSESMTSAHVHGPKPAVSAASLGPLRGTNNASLSVITEVSDEDTLLSRRGTMKIPKLDMPGRPDDLSELHELQNMSTSMNTSTDSDNSTERSRHPKLRRGTAQDLETPAVEMAPLSPGLINSSTLSEGCTTDKED